MKASILCLLLIAAATAFGTITTTDTPQETIITTTPCACEREAILLHDIKELSFMRGATTLSRREPAIAQLECIGGSAKGVLEPNVVRCVNIGHIEPHWRCEAVLDTTVKLGGVTVTCEGYEGPHDPYVLRGSCGLQYSLEYTEWGPYIWGKFLRILSILVLTPLKWAVVTAACLAGGLVVLAAIRRPTRRNRHSTQSDDKQKEKGEPSKWDLNWLQNSQNEYEVIGEGEDAVWTGRLRPRKPTGEVGAGKH